MIALLILSVYAAPKDEVFCVTNTDQTTCDDDVVSTDSPCYFDTGSCATVTDCGQLGDRCDVEILGGDDYCGTKEAILLDKCQSALAECATLLDEQECGDNTSFKCAWADEACGYSGADSGAGYAIFSAAMSALFVASLF